MVRHLGKLRDDYYAEPLSSELYKTPSGKVVPTMYPQTEPMNTGTEPTQETQTKMSQTPTQPSSNGSEETTLLGSGQEETTLLGNGETGTEETTLLGNQNRNTEEQEIPGYNGETALLTPEMEKAIHFDAASPTIAVGSAGGIAFILQPSVRRNGASNSRHDETCSCCTCTWASSCSSS